LGADAGDEAGGEEAFDAFGGFGHVVDDFFGFELAAVFAVDDFAGYGELFAGFELGQAAGDGDEGGAVFGAQGEGDDGEVGGAVDFTDDDAHGGIGCAGGGEGFGGWWFCEEVFEGFHRAPVVMTGRGVAAIG